MMLSLIVAAAANGWSFSPVPVCTLHSAESPTEIEVTYDGSEYVIRLTDRRGWPLEPVFSIEFAPFGPVISTTRHRIDGPTLSVTDSGFGNVLNGLQFNHTATARIGEVAREFDLDGAADPVRAFRVCPGTPTA